MVAQAGVLAVQGDVPEHARALEEAFGPNIEVRQVRSPAGVRESDLIVLPGGESTTISQLVSENELADPLRAHAAGDDPILATCAGLILLADEVPDDRVENLGLLAVRVERNAFGRQRDSFEAPLDIQGLDRPFPGVFIRAPRIAEVGAAEIIATHDGEPVAVRQGSIVGASFHPELTEDPRMHRLLAATPAR